MLSCYFVKTLDVGEKLIFKPDGCTEYLECALRLECDHIIARLLHLTRAPSVITCSEMGLSDVDTVTLVTWLIHLYLMDNNYD